MFVVAIQYFELAKKKHSENFNGAKRVVLHRFRHSRPPVVGLVRPGLYTMIEGHISDWREL